MIKLVTHNNIMHADEISAIALIKIFIDDNVEIDRVDYEHDNYDNYDMVIDIGRRFDGVKFFDHHQYKGGKSSAGLIWDYIGQNQKYPEISKLISLIDKNDTGKQKAKAFEFSSLIKAYNNQILTLSKDAQLEKFKKAVDFATIVFSSLKDMQEARDDAKKIIQSSAFFNNNKNIIELSNFTPFWSSYING